MLNSTKIKMLFRLCIIKVHSSSCPSDLQSKEVLLKRCLMDHLTRAFLCTARQGWSLFTCSIGNGCSQPLSSCLLGRVKTTSPCLQVLSSFAESGCSATWSSMVSSAILCWAHSFALPKDFVLFLCMVCQLLTQSWLLPCRGHGEILLLPLLQTLDELWDLSFRFSCSSRWWSYPPTLDQVMTMLPWSLSWNFWCGCTLEHLCICLCRVL